jgi:hypothetical protein
MAESELGEFYGTRAASRGPVSAWVGLAGAATSLALVAGVGIWGYQLMMRDANGVPVVRALSGPMRIEPADPGGEQMAHQGLAVNQVAAEGTAADVAEELVLAPEAPALLDQDLPTATLIAPPPAAPEPAPEAQAAEAPPSATDLAVLAALQETEAPDSPLIQEATAQIRPVLAIARPEPTAALIPASVKGVSQSLVPPSRPAHLVRLASVLAPTPEPAAPVEISADTLASGARLVQLGAYDSADAARTAWDKIDAEFSEVMQGKSRVVQQATSGGKTFYRLRAAGFEDLADARRFCATLSADRPDQLCVPVAIR